VYIDPYIEQAVHSVGSWMFVKLKWETRQIIRNDYLLIEETDNEEYHPPHDDLIYPEYLKEKPFSEYSPEEYQGYTKYTEGKAWAFQRTKVIAKYKISRLHTDALYMCSIMIHGLINPSDGYQEFASKQFFKQIKFLLSNTIEVGISEEYRQYWLDFFDFLKDDKTVQYRRDFDSELTPMGNFISEGIYQQIEKQLLK
jgi:hypothetical protein